VIPLSAPEDWLHNGEQLVTLELATTTASTALWRDYRLPLHQVRVEPGTRRERCLSTAGLSTFSGASVPLRPGTFTLYRHASGSQEVQVSYRRCNLRALCACSVAVRIQDIIIAFDICSRGYLQVWSPSATSTAPARLPAGARLLSMDEGRAYRLLLPSGTVVSLGPLLSTVEVEASAGDLGATEGLCGAFGRQPRALGPQPGDWRSASRSTAYIGFHAFTLGPLLEGTAILDVQPARSPMGPTGNGARVQKSGQVLWGLRARQ
jgi:hypothetical protein